MPVKWIDVSSLSFNVLLLLEKVQLSWFPCWLPKAELAVALRANPIVEWYMRHRCPGLNSWLDESPTPGMAERHIPLDQLHRSADHLFLP